MNYLHFETPPFPYFEESNKDTYFPGDKHIDRKNFEFFDFIFVTKGCLYMTEEKKQFEIHANQGLILQPLLHHFSHQVVDEVTDFYWLHFQTTGNWKVNQKPQYIYQNEIILPQYFDLSNPEVLIQHFEKLYDLFRIVNDEQLLEREALLLQLFQILMTHLTDDFSSNVTEIAKNTVLIINQKFTESIEIKDVADELKFHPTYISRCMKKIYGVSAKQYLQSLRLKHAQSLLKSTHHSIEEVAYASGFNSLSFFSKSFTKKFGLSPSQFRNHYQK